VNSERGIGTVYKVAQFLVWGLPAFLFAIPLNYTLVEVVAWPKPIAYAVVLIFQVVLNFFMCRWFVFKPGDHKTPGRQFIEFFAGILGFRFADWAIYSLLVQFLPDLYIGIQFLNVLLFAALKYRFSRKVIEGT
jgi:putative flippase GtrA